MKLYYSPGACSLAPHIVAREAGLAIDLVKVDLKAHRLESGEDYYAINPRGYVPMLELDDGTRLTEVAVLTQLLAERAPQAGLLPPAGSIERLQAQMWLNYVATELHKTFSWFFHPQLPDAMRGLLNDRLANRLSHLEKHLEGREYLVGDRFTVADAYAYTVINWAGVLKIDLTPYPNIKAFQKRIGSRPKVREALVAEGLVKN
ncbi:MAG TPA: glutathione transferase GstA [Burkholderiales bacterium]